MKKTMIQVLQWWDNLSDDAKDGFLISIVVVAFILVGTFDSPREYYVYEEDGCSFYSHEMYVEDVKEDPLSFLSDLDMYTDEEIEEIYDIIESDSTRYVVGATVYNPVESQCDSNPLETADQSIIDIDKLNSGSLMWIAVSRDLLEYYSYGDKILITSASDSSINGVYEIHDTMAKRHTRKIDFLRPIGMEGGKWPRDIIIEKVI